MSKWNSKANLKYAKEHNISEKTMRDYFYARDKAQRELKKWNDANGTSMHLPKRFGTVQQLKKGGFIRGSAEESMRAKIEQLNKYASGYGEGFAKFMNREAEERTSNYISRMVENGFSGDFVKKLNTNLTRKQRIQLGSAINDELEQSRDRFGRVNPKILELYKLFGDEDGLGYRDKDREQEFVQLIDEIGIDLKTVFNFVKKAL